MDEVRVWAGVRTQSQIEDNMCQPVTTPQTGLLGYWPLNIDNMSEDGSGNVTALDMSGNGRHMAFSTHGDIVACGPNFEEEGGTYRYGFNGMEKSDEVYGEGNAYDFGARIHDPRIGR